MVVGGINILTVLTLETGETSTRAVPIEDVNAMEKVFSNQNFSKVVRFPDKTKAEIIANMQELFESSSKSDVNHLYLSVRYLLVAIKRYLQVGIHFKIELFRLWQTPILTEKSLYRNCINTLIL
ncbi:caspase family protein [Streptococcus pneumoniae]|uniref:caspase family protein n=1 Tax=Streptococcus pseudopneumoniae TaxID=257758 RepID=UPI003126E33F